jgi:putative membrane protein
MDKILKNKNTILIFIIILFHTVGIVGMSLPDRKEYFLSLSPYNLLLSLLVTLIGSNRKNFTFYIFIFFVFCLGFLVEWIGVHTGYLFGNYLYGKNLGAKFLDIPLIIGVNWVVLIVITGNITYNLFKYKWINIFSASFLMVFLDFLIEPIAILSDYWLWENNHIPMYNYVCWFGISLLIHFIFQKLKLTEQNRVHLCLYIVLVLFFGIQLIIHN